MIIVVMTTLCDDDHINIDLSYNASQEPNKKASDHHS